MIGSAALFAEDKRAGVVAHKMQRYKMSLLGLSETCETQTGPVRLQSGETSIYSGHPKANAPHTEVAFVTSNTAQ